MSAVYAVTGPYLKTVGRMLGPGPRPNKGVATATARPGPPDAPALATQPARWPKMKKKRAGSLIISLLRGEQNVQRHLIIAVVGLCCDRFGDSAVFNLPGIQVMGGMKVLRFVMY